MRYYLVWDTIETSLTGELYVVGLFKTEHEANKAREEYIGKDVLSDFDTVDIRGVEVSKWTGKN